MGQPLNAANAGEQAAASLFEEKVAAELQRKGVADRRQAIRNVGRRFPKMHAAWCKSKTVSE